MAAGNGEEMGAQRKGTVAVVALTDTDAGLMAAYMIAEDISEGERHEIARKLRAIAEAVDY